MARASQSCKTGLICAAGRQCGAAVDPSGRRRGDADMLIAVTASTKPTWWPASGRRSLQHSDAYRACAQHRAAAASEPDGRGGFRATQVIFPEQTVTDYLLKLVDFPEALQVLEFADGRASLIAVGRSPVGRWYRSRSRSCGAISRMSTRASSRCFATTPACESTATR